MFRIRAAFQSKAIGLLRPLGAGIVNADTRGCDDFRGDISVIFYPKSVFRRNKFAIEVFPYFLRYCLKDKKNNKSIVLK